MSQQTVTKTKATAIAVPLEWHFAPVNPDRIARFLALPRAQRIVLAENFAINKAEMLEWASRYRSEVPLVDGEFFFIALFTSAADDD